MSPPDLRQPESPAGDGQSVPRRKAVLFCPDCGHESHAGGDWLVTDDYLARTRRLRCPECSATITARPLPADSADRRDAVSATVPEPVGRTFETVTRLWTQSMRHWVEWSRRATPSTP